MFRALQEEATSSLTAVCHGTHTKQLRVLSIGYWTAFDRGGQFLKKLALLKQAVLHPSCEMNMATVKSLIM